MSDLASDLGRMADAVERLADIVERALWHEPEPLTWTIDEAAEQLGVSPRVASELASRGEIPSLRLGRAVRVPRAALRNYVEGVAS